MNSNSRIFVAGHKGLVGSAILRLLLKSGFNNIIVRTSRELDLRNQSQVDAFFDAERPQYVFLAAAKVGGILANSAQPATFIRDNLQIQTNTIDAAYRSGVEKLLFLGSSCIYPRDARQPIGEQALLTGALEKTNESYALAKIAGLNMCQAYRRQFGFNAICAMPTNLYGEGDNFDLASSHVLPALIRKVHEAKISNSPSVEIWGSGTPRREFLHVDDMADAAMFLMREYDEEAIINVGTGEDITIRSLAELIVELVGYRGELEFDQSRLDGTPRKLLDVGKLSRLGWTHSIGLREGIRRTYEWYLSGLGQGAKDSLAY